MASRGCCGYGSDAHNHGAALVIVAVFSGFAAGDLVMFQQMGFGIAIALLIDATLIRSVLVPAAMQLRAGVHKRFIAARECYPARVTPSLARGDRGFAFSGNGSGL
jgi:hypothetical protein